MPFFELSDEQVSGLTDEVKALLGAPSGEVDRLRDHANTLLNEKKAEVSKRTAAEAAALDAKAKAQEAGLVGNKEDTAKVQSQLDDALGRIAEQQSQYDELKQGYKQKELMTEAQKLASALTKDTGRMEILTKEFLNKIDVDDGRLIVLDDGGNQTISTTEELSLQMKSKYGFLCDANPAAGGGSVGGSGGAAAPKSFSEMTATEKAQLANSDIVKYNQLAGT